MALVSSIRQDRHLHVLRRDLSRVERDRTLVEKLQLLFRNILTFLRGRCPTCAKRIGTSEHCHSCQDFLQDSSRYQP